MSDVMTIIFETAYHDATPADQNQIKGEPRLHLEVIPANTESISIDPRDCTLGVLPKTNV